MARFTGWAERRAGRMSRPRALIDAGLAGLWGIFGTPILWVLVTPMFRGQGSDAILYGLATAAVLSLAGYVVTSRLVAREPTE